ncbi:ATP-binding Cassette (ABC) Superfamily, partial [Achlya hypogyna]
VKEQFPHLQTSCVTIAEDSAVRLPDVILEPDVPDNKVKCGLVEAEEREVGAVTATTYTKYFSASGYNGLAVGGLVVMLFALAQAALSMTDWFMGYWATNESSSHLAFAWVYVGMAVGSVILVGLRSVVLLNVAVVCSKALHHRLLSRVLWAPVNTFFDVTPVGRVLNRFSSDLDQVDSQLPMFGLFFAQIAFQVGAIVVVCAASLPYVLVAYVPVAVLFYVIQKLYVIASSDLKRMDATTRSPIVSLITESIAGLSTLRAFKMVHTALQTNRDRIDHNTKFFLTYRISSQWLSMRLDWLATIVVAAVSFLVIACKASLGVATAGLALTYATQLSTYLSRLTSTYAMVETVMTSVERLEHY